MKKLSTMDKMLLAGVIFALAVLCVGCKSSTSVLVSTATALGIEATVVDQYQPPKVKIGYARGEVVIVPTNRDKETAKDSYEGGASDSTDVMMSLEIANIFNFTDTLISQKLAVGKNAIDNADVLFGKPVGTDTSKTADTAKPVMELPAAPVK